MIVTFNKQQRSELFNRDHFESLLNRIFLPQKSENVRPNPSNSIENATPFLSIHSWKCDPIQRHIPLASYKEVPSPPPPPRVVRKGRLSQIHISWRPVRRSLSKNSRLASPMNGICNLWENKLKREQDHIIMLKQEVLSFRNKTNGWRGRVVQGIVCNCNWLVFIVVRCKPNSFDSFVYLAASNSNWRITPNMPYFLARS